MEFLSELWLAILLSAVLVFIVSSVLHMVIPIHKGDYTKMANEDAVLEAMRANGVEPGAYMFPCAGSMKEMGTPEMVEKLKKGPVGWLTVTPPAGSTSARASSGGSCAALSSAFSWLMSAGTASIPARPISRSFS